MKESQLTENMLNSQKMDNSSRTSQNSRLNLKKSMPMFESKLQKQEVPNQRDSPYISSEKKLDEIKLNKPKFDSCELNYDEEFKTKAATNSEINSQNDIKVVDSVEIEESGNIDENIITENIKHHMKNLRADGLEYYKAENKEHNQEAIYDTSGELEKPAKPVPDDKYAPRELKIEEMKKIVRIIFKHYDWDASGYLENDEIMQIWQDFYEDVE